MIDRRLGVLSAVLLALVIAPAAWAQETPDSPPPPDAPPAESPAPDENAAPAEKPAPAENPDRAEPSQPPGTQAPAAAEAPAGTQPPAPTAHPDAAPEPGATGPFPFPCELREQVDFWTKVFSTWSLGQVILHDVDHPGLIYEVFDLPGPIGDAYRPEQRDLVHRRRDELEARLKVLERKVAERTPLTDEEKELALKITTSAGTGALAGSHERVRSQRGLLERFRRGVEISGRYDALFRVEFRAAGLPEDLAYLPHVESSFQSSARSSAGAVGVWQFTRPAARKFMQLNSAIDERLDPVASARGAARYLAYAYAELGDWALAVTSYNHGIEGMARAKSMFGTDFARIVREYDGKGFGFASKNFYAEFLAAREIAKNPSRYFTDALQPEPPLSWDRVVLDRSVPPLHLARAYGVPLGDLAEMNPAWTRRAVRGGQSLPAGTQVWLPEGTLTRRSPTPAPVPSKASPAPPDAAAVSRPETPAPPPGAARSRSRAASSALTDAIVHVVRRGETLFKIAMHYNVSLDDLLGVNRLSAHSILRPGQRLRIPVTP